MSYFLAPDRFDTPEFSLRALQPGNGKLMAETIRASYDHLKTFMPWASTEYSDELGEEFVRTSWAHYLLNENYGIGIFSPDGQRYLGGTGFHLRWGGLETETVEIGMWIAGSEAGKGLGTRTLLALLEWGFTEWPWQRLVWLCDTGNLASARVAEKAGMVKEARMRCDFPVGPGKRRDTFMFAMLKDEWLSSHRKG
jgi:RimJ/RimL family protein N-acetyltransferase